MNTSPKHTKNNNSFHIPGRNLLANVIDDYYSRRNVAVNKNSRNLPSSRTPDRIHKAQLDKLPSLKPTNRFLTPHQRPAHNPYKTKLQPVQRNFELTHKSSKRLIEKPKEHKEIRNLSVGERSASNYHSNIRDNSNGRLKTEYNKIDSSTHQNIDHSRRLELLNRHNIRRKYKSGLDAYSSNSSSQQSILRVPQAKTANNLSVNTSFNTRNNSLVQPSTNNTTVSIGQLGTFLTSIGSTGNEDSFITDKVDYRENPKRLEKIPVRPLYSNGNSTRVLQQISDNRGRKLRTDGSKSNNLSFNESDHTMSISPSKNRHNMSYTQTNELEILFENPQNTSRTVKSDQRRGRKRASESNISLLDACRPALESSRLNASFSIDDAYSRLNELTQKNHDARGSLLRIQESVAEIKTNKKKVLDNSFLKEPPSAHL